MSIRINLDVMMARRHIAAGDLADRIGLPRPICPS